MPNTENGPRNETPADLRRPWHQPRLTVLECEETNSKITTFVAELAPTTGPS